MSKFHPATKYEREAALDIGSVPPKKKKIYCDEAFVSLGRQKAGSWLAEHREYGQTFQQYNKYNHIQNSARNTIYLCCLEKFSEDAPTKNPSITKLVQFLKAFYQVDVKVIEAAGAKVRYRMNGSIFQHNAPDILNHLRKIIPSDAYCVIGVTMIDIYNREDWNFVFGWASLSDRVGVFSFARYHPSFYGDVMCDEEDYPMSTSHQQNIERLILYRSCKVASHEIGHMFGIKHCTFYQCAMNGSNHLEESDSRPLELCPIELRKLQKCIGFDEKVRYQQLLAFFMENPTIFPNEITWFNERLKSLQ